MGKKIFNKKILFATVLCSAFSMNIANGSIIEDGKYVKYINHTFNGITNQQNLINYGSKWGAQSAQYFRLDS